MEQVITALNRHTAIVTINRAEAMNALSLDVRRQLVNAVRLLDVDTAVRAIVLTGAGDRAFSAGLDLKEVGGDAGLLKTESLNDANLDPVRAFTECTKPTIAAVNGVAITGGLELAMSCDMILAADNARLADTHSRISVLPGWGLSQRLPRAIGLARAKEMSFSGRFVTAEEAERWGLINRVVASDLLMESVLEIAEAIAAAEPGYLVKYKALMNDGFAGTLSDGMELELRLGREHNEALDPRNLASNSDRLRRGDPDSGA